MRCTGENPDLDQFRTIIPTLAPSHYKKGLFTVNTSCTINAHQCRCFDILTAEEKAYLDSHSANVQYKKREILCKQGSFVSQIMHVEKGLVKSYIDDGRNTLVLKILPAGSLLGLTSIAEEFNTHQYSAMAYTDTEVRLIDMAAFRNLVDRNLVFAREVIDILSGNNVQISGRFFALIHKQAYGRLADILLCLTERIFKNPEFDLPLSRQDLGELSGLSSETVVRLLKKFEAEGLIRISGKTFTVIDAVRLRRISETG